ncbi:MAG: hypothetical protein AVDCRST_MAG56-5927 [uncultured Cytophagales bacterium]|uniref:Uncharacterized protein n=1 Tax=uncultured Cytophagales bacterium TaxID=158755 RepID=A0A6J4KJ23_9SPHI|nr:MAG: hypothetical protein AVDCRST_MAG56-5927 [uncultured Cytophagales bacterium]
MIGPFMPSILLSFNILIGCYPFMCLLQSLLPLGYLGGASHMDCFSV